jgi:hypothetical protein
MDQNIFSVVEVTRLITQGRILLLAGEEALLRQLPPGKWIGGTIPYFIAPEQGGVVSRNMIFATDISAVAADVSIQVYDPEGLAEVYVDAPQSSCSFLIVPAASAVHSSFALNGPHYREFGARPLIGWVAGVHLGDLRTEKPKVFDGSTGQAHEQEAVVMHLTLTPGKAVDVGILNIFEQGDGDTLTFGADGFSCTEVLVNGVRENFADYIAHHHLDTKLPLVADYYGALVNISFQGIDPGGEVKFYAPVFSGIRYKHARPISNYGAAFSEQLRTIRPSADHIVFSCNCILNYLYSDLEGHKTGPFVGPITFGEIAYQLLNQTLVYLEVHDV